MNKYTVIALDDHADGNAYMADHTNTSYPKESYLIAYNYLKSHDHVCIISNDDIRKCHEITLKDLRPYSIIIEAGQHFEL